MSITKHRIEILLPIEASYIRFGTCGQLVSYVNVDDHQVLGMIIGIVEERIIGRKRTHAWVLWNDHHEHPWVKMTRSKAPKLRVGAQP